MGAIAEAVKAWGDNWRLGEGARIPRSRDEEGSEAADIVQMLRFTGISCGRDLDLRRMLVLDEAVSRCTQWIDPDDPDWGSEHPGRAPFECQFCGAPSWIDPSDQSLPPDYCHPDDHGEPPEEEDGFDVDLREKAAAEDYDAREAVQSCNPQPSKASCRFPDQEPGPNYWYLRELLDLAWVAGSRCDDETAKDALKALSRAAADCCADTAGLSKWPF
jgi:hypothetical protein